MKKWKVNRFWTHVQGHVVKTNWIQEPVEAESENDAIMKFKEQNQDVGQWIKKIDHTGTWAYGTSFSIGYDFVTNRVFAEQIN